MGAKSLKFALKNDRVERVEAAMVKIGLAVNSNVAQLGKGIKDANEGIGLVYDALMARTLRGRFKALVKWIGGKK